MEDPDCGFLLFYIANILKVALGIYPQIVVNILICHKDIHYS